MVSDSSIPLDGKVPTPRLQTERLLIRGFQPGDWPAVYAYSADLEVMRYILYRADTQDGARAFVDGCIAQEREQPRRNWQFAVCILGADPLGQLIGGAGIWLTDEAGLEAEIGYCFHRAYWNQGYASETVRALLAFGFGELGVSRIIARCNAENTASVRVVEKCGMHFEHRKCDEIWGFDRYWDELQYVVSTTDR